MKLSDLKLGQVVKTRAGERYYYFGSVIVNNDGHEAVSSYNCDMTHCTCNDMDIVTVYKFRSSYPACMSHINDDMIIVEWEKYVTLN